MAIALGSKFVYDGDSEEEIIPQKALEEGMWISDDEDEEFEDRTTRAVPKRPRASTTLTPTPTSEPASKERSSSGFWGSVYKFFNGRTTSREIKPPTLKTV